MRGPRFVVLLVALAAVPARGAGGGRDGAQEMDKAAAELAAARKTRELVQAKLDEREEDLRGRVRAVYKLTRAGDLPLWVDERARAEFVRRRAAAHRMLLRDLEERKLLRDELARAEADEERLAVAAQAAAEAAAPKIERHSLLWPASGEIEARFGPYKDPAAKLPLVRRGVDIGCERYEDIVSVAPGTVRYAGPIRGLGKGVVIDHGQGIVSITAGLVYTRVSTGYRVEEGIPVGDAMGDTIYLEVRRAGRPVDPEGLLAD
jgi:septal ring factor EnvC (AmiA/AmiB activator)